MKKIVIMMLFVLGVSSAYVFSKCINASHQKKREMLAEGGIKKETNTYTCMIKASETGVFDSKGNCKFCGCNAADHDNT